MILPAQDMSPVHSRPFFRDEPVLDVEPSFSSAPTAVVNGASVAGGRNAGLTLMAAFSVRRTSSLMEGTFAIS